jgi:hypothetical protein
MTDLFSPLDLGGLQLPNRIIMAPLTRSRATLERVPTPMMAEHYMQRADAGLIIAEATNVVPQSIAWDCAPGIFTDAQIDAWASLVRAVHLPDVAYKNARDWLEAAEKKEPAADHERRAKVRMHASRRDGPRTVHHGALRQGGVRGARDEPDHSGIATDDRGAE